MKLIHITTKTNWAKIKESGYLKRPIDLNTSGSTIHKDKIFFFAFVDEVKSQDIEILKQQVASDKSLGDIGIDVIEYEAKDMIAIELLDEVFDPECIIAEYINERKMISQLLGREIDYYAISEIVTMERLREIVISY